ncbi:MAG: hypothetical protein AAFN50_02360 [Pseudomonadota bacterium]
MVEKIKDAQDRTLESLFASDPIADDGFSERVVRRISRKLWVRRLTLPVAALIGGLIAYEPVAGLIGMLGSFISATQVDFLGPVQGALPQVQMLIMGGLLLVVGLVSMRLIED